MSGKSKPLRPWPFALLIVPACAAANFLGGLLGLAASVLCAGPRGSPDTTLGVLIGGAVGLLAGGAWCALVLRRALVELRRARKALGTLVVVGALWGSVLGGLCLLGLAVRLMLASDAWGPGTLVMGLGAGVIVGAAFGLLMGLLAWAAAALAAGGASPAAHGRGTRA